VPGVAPGKMKALGSRAQQGCGNQTARQKYTTANQAYARAETMCCKKVPTASRHRSLAMVWKDVGEKSDPELGVGRAKAGSTSCKMSFSCVWAESEYQRQNQIFG